MKRKFLSSFFFHLLWNFEMFLIKIVWKYFGFRLPFLTEISVEISVETGSLKLTKTETEISAETENFRSLVHTEITSNFLLSFHTSEKR